MRMHPALPPEDSGDGTGAGRSPNCSRTPDQRDVGFARMKQRVAGSAEHYDPGDEARADAVDCSPIPS